MQFNYAEALGDGVLGKIASFLTEKELPERSWIRNKLWHKICLEHDRYWVEDLREMNKAHPITLQMYDTINQSIEEIFAFVTRPPIVFHHTICDLSGTYDSKYWLVDRYIGTDNSRW